MHISIDYFRIVELSLSTRMNALSANDAVATSITMIALVFDCLVSQRMKSLPETILCVLNVDRRQTTIRTCRDISRTPHPRDENIETFLLIRLVVNKEMLIWS